MCAFSCLFLSLFFLETIKSQWRTHSLYIFSQDSMKDFSFHGNTMYYSVYYIPFLVFPMPQNIHNKLATLQQLNTMLMMLCGT